MESWREYLIKSSVTFFLNSIILTHWVTDANIRNPSNESSFQHESFCISASFSFVTYININYTEGIFKKKVFHLIENKIQHNMKRCMYVLWMYNNYYEFLV